MKDCSSIRQMLPLSAGGELDERELRSVNRHLNGCVACREEQAEFLLLLEVSRKVARSGYQVGDSFRSAIAAEAAERASRRAWRWHLPLSLYSLTMPRAGLVAAAAAVLAVFLTLPALLHRGSIPSTSDSQGVAKIQVEAEAGRVRLAWTDGRKGTYTVYKSDSPRGFSRKEAHVVKGTVWTDTDPGSSAIVFYSVE